MQLLLLDWPCRTITLLSTKKEEDEEGPVEYLCWSWTWRCIREHLGASCDELQGSDEGGQ